MRKWSFEDPGEREDRGAPIEFQRMGFGILNIVLSLHQHKMVPRPGKNKGHITVVDGQLLGVPSWFQRRVVRCLQASDSVVATRLLQDFGRLGHGPEDVMTSAEDLLPMVTGPVVNEGCDANNNLGGESEKGKTGLILDASPQVNKHGGYCSLH